VLPLIPVSGISLEECAVLARQLAARMAREAGIPCYAYEASALKPERRNLAVCRAGEYEALEEKLTSEALKPDYMNFVPTSIDAIPESVRRCGISVVGARDFLIAVNWNLNTTDRHVAHAIACDVREKGRPGKPGTLKCAKAIGWYIEEYGIAQVSMNLTNMNVTPLHSAFEEVSRCASIRGVRVTGTEIIGLVPKRALISAGIHFMEQQQLPIDCTEADIIATAVKTMRLDDLRPFDVRKKVIEYLLEETSTAETPTEL
jgi:glutamate formiminotransferase/formiminotetrahydrofolate cyclodeaminase